MNELFLQCRMMTKSRKLPWRGPLDDEPMILPQIPFRKSATPKESFDWYRYETDFRNASGRNERLRKFKR